MAQDQYPDRIFRFLLLLFFALVQISPAPGFAFWGSQKYTRYQEPDFLTFDELIQLTKDPYPDGALGNKLQRFWRTPIISNEAWYQGVRPTKKIHPTIGPIMVVGTWNIEKSMRMHEVIKLFTAPEQFQTLVDPAKAKPGEASFENILRQRQRLVNADILILEEMDIGHNRSGYLNAAAELAKALGMNYAYGAEQLEIDPVYLGTDKVHFEDGSIDEEMSRYVAADPAKYRGVFGSAVLSKYPIKHVEVFQLKNQAYDWYHEELGKLAFIEKSRRIGTQLLLKNVITRELKVGGRIFFRVDLAVPELPGGTLTIINIHLEIKCQPQGRELQMAEILSYIKDIKNPVILAGDFNAAPNDLSSTSATRIVKRTAKNPGTWLNAAVTFLTPYGPLNMARGVTNSTRNFQNPLMKSVPIVAPNAVYPLFKMIEDYRFSDGSAFDFRGDKERSIGKKKGTLANSNQRDFKGFKTTFEVKRPIGPIIGKLRLDWLFVKSYLRDPADYFGAYKFAPHFGETLEDLNTSLSPQASDHHPNIVDLPFDEPKM